MSHAIALISLAYRKLSLHTCDLVWWFHVSAKWVSAIVVEDDWPNAENKSINPGPPLNAEAER